MSIDDFENKLEDINIHLLNFISKSEKEHHIIIDNLHEKIHENSDKISSNFEDLHKKIAEVTVSKYSVFLL